MVSMRQPHEHYRWGVVHIDGLASLDAVLIGRQIVDVAWSIVLAKTIMQRSKTVAYTLTNSLNFAAGKSAEWVVSIATRLSLGLFRSSFETLTFCRSCEATAKHRRRGIYGHQKSRDGGVDQLNEAPKLSRSIWTRNNSLPTITNNNVLRHHQLLLAVVITKSTIPWHRVHHPPKNHRSARVGRNNPSRLCFAPKLRCSTLTRLCYDDGAMANPITVVNLRPSLSQSETVTVIPVKNWPWRRDTCRTVDAVQMTRDRGTNERRTRLPRVRRSFASPRDDKTRRTYTCEAKFVRRLHACSLEAAFPPTSSQSNRIAPAERSPRRPNLLIHASKSAGWFEKNRMQTCSKQNARELTIHHWQLQQSPAVLITCCWRGCW